MWYCIKSIKHIVCYENGQAEESKSEVDPFVKIRIYGADKSILFTENYNLEFHSAAVRASFQKSIGEYGLHGLKDDYILVHMQRGLDNYYFTIKKSNTLTTQFTYRINNSQIYRSKCFNVKYEDLDGIMNICANI